MTHTTAFTTLPSGRVWMESGCFAILCPENSKQNICSGRSSDSPPLSWQAFPSAQRRTMAHGCLREHNGRLTAAGLSGILTRFPFHRADTRHRNSLQKYKQSSKPPNLISNRPLFANILLKCLLCSRAHTSRRSRRAMSFLTERTSGSYLTR